jgi:hypothetical protein
MVAASLLPSRASAQMPGLPVLQNAFANPGITVGVNYGHSTEFNGIGAAGAWAPGSARFVLSAGVGTATPDTGKGATAYGGRVAVPVMKLMSGSIGLGAFGGIGGMSQNGFSLVVAGLSAGYRRPMGSMGFSVHAAPSWQRSAITVAGKTFSTSAIRVSSGVDISFGGRYGATVGVEAGGKTKKDEPGPSGSVFGLGFSYALRRVR